jgi:hypothetical protein
MQFDWTLALPMTLLIVYFIFILQRYSWRICAWRRSHISASAPSPARCAERGCVVWLQTSAFASRRTSPSRAPSTSVASSLVLAQEQPVRAMAPHPVCPAAALTVQRCLVVSVYWQRRRLMRRSRMPVRASWHHCASNVRA